MPEYDNRNTGMLFTNERKLEDKHPDYSGHYIDGDGNEHFLDAWIRTGPKGRFLSLRTKLKTQQKTQSPPTSSARDSDTGGFF